MNGSYQDREEENSSLEPPSPPTKKKKKNQANPHCEKGIQVNQPPSQGDQIISPFRRPMNPFPWKSMAVKIFF